MSGGKGVAWILIVAAVAACGWFYWKNYDVVISEPSIESQISAQMDAAKSGASVPLPIPLTIGKSSVTSLDTKAVAAALGTVGFVEEKAAMDMPSGLPGMDMDISQKIYSCERMGAAAMILTIGGKLGGTTAVSFMADDAVGSLLPGMGMPDAGMPDIGSMENDKSKKSNKPGIVGVGPLTLGMTEKRVRRAIGKIPHDTMSDPTSLLMSPEALKGMSPRSAGDYAASLSMLKSSGAHLARGRYFYTLQFADGRLGSVIVMDLGPMFKSFPMKDGKKEEALRMMFDK
jgi:hypothetical protein